MAGLRDRASDSEHMEFHVEVIRTPRRGNNGRAGEEGGRSVCCVGNFDFVNLSPKVQYQSFVLRQRVVGGGGGDLSSAFVGL